MRTKLKRCIPIRDELRRCHYRIPGQPNRYHHQCSGNGSKVAKAKGIWSGEKEKMFINWFNNLSNRSLVITILICISLIYVSYTFNSCLVTNLGRTLNKVRHLRVSPLHILENKQNALSQNPLKQFFLSTSFWTSKESANTSALVLTNTTNYTPQSIVTSKNSVHHLPYKKPFNNSSTTSSSAPRILDGSPKYRLLRQQGSRPSRHLPDTLIIGVKKSGTRALLEFIRLHPDVRAAGCEVHFFDRHYQKGLHWYRHHMPYTIEGQITMEKTPSYFVTKEVPQRVHRMNGNTK